jgi:hypothetical protein
MPVNEGRVRLLVAALRSGLYKKTESTLHECGTWEGKHSKAPAGAWCCLGVAGDIASRMGLDIPRSYALDDDSIEEDEEYIDGEQNYMSDAVQEWYGFTEMDPVLTLPDGGQNRASQWNDDTNTTFEDIAAGFERTYLS